jgi:predicted nucleic acid-binding protein
VLRGEVEAVAPDLVFLEAANALAGYVHAGELDQDEATSRLDDLLELPLDAHSSRTLAPQAHALAIARRLSAYDASYLALAIGYDAVLVTADKRLAAEAERSALLPESGPPG